MMRALWTSGLGMIAQQFNVDVISNNLSNVNTSGYKKERAEFKDMLYETQSRAYTMDGKGKPVNLQVGHGVTVVATVKNFSIGNVEKTDNPLDLAIQGEGFFTVRNTLGDTKYTRDGSFKVSNSPEGNKLTTSDGLSVLDESGNEIFINGSIMNMMISPSGDVGYLDTTTSSMVSTGQKIGMVKFPNRYGLESIGGNLYSQTSATGDPVPDSETGQKSVILQNFLESSNVQVVEEMLKLIVAQKAYEINSKAIQTADDMLGIANNLKK